MTEVSHSCRGTFEIMEPTEHQQSEKKKLLLVPVIMMLLCIVILTLQPEEHKYQNLYILASEDLCTFVIVGFKFI